MEWPIVESQRILEQLLDCCDVDVSFRLSLTCSSWRRACQDLSGIKSANFSHLFTKVTDTVLESVLGRWKIPERLEELNLDYCVCLTDKSLQYVESRFAAHLRRLDLSHVELITSEAFGSLLQRCSRLEMLRIRASDVRRRRLHVDSVVECILRTESTKTTLKVLDLGTWSPRPELAERLLLERPLLDRNCLLRTFAKVSRKDARGSANDFLKRLISEDAPNKWSALEGDRKSSVDTVLVSQAMVDVEDSNLLETIISERPFDVDAVVALSAHYISLARRNLEMSRLSEASANIKHSIRIHIAHLKKGVSPNEPERYTDPLARQPLLLFPEPAMYLPAREYLRDLAKDMMIEGNTTAAYFVHRTLYELTGQVSSLWSLLFISMTCDKYLADMSIWRSELRKREDTKEISTTAEFQETLNCMLRKVCTATSHGHKRDVAQFWCECPECKLSGMYGICAGCMQKCHRDKGHKAYFLEFIPVGFCDCKCH